MADISRFEYTAEERGKYDTAYSRLREMVIWSAAPDAQEFRRVLDAELAAGLPIDWPEEDGWTLLHWVVFEVPAVRAGLPQLLINAGADVDARDGFGRTPLGYACREYVGLGAPESFSLICLLLASGARPELDEGWKVRDWEGLKQRARRDWLKAYITAWNERRAVQDRGEAAAPAFEYSL